MHITKREKRIHGTRGFPFHVYPALDRAQSDIVPYHWHPENEIIAIEYGEVGITIGDKQYVGKQGDVFFVEAEQLHEIRGGVDGGFHAYVYPMDFLQFARIDTAQNEILAPYSDGELVVKTELRNDHYINSKVKGTLDDILQACVEHKNGYQLKVKAGILYILSLVAGEGLMSARQDKIDYKNQTLRQIIAYLEENYMMPLSLNDVSSNFGLSPQYFCTFFKENTGRTLTQHINFLRTEQAAMLLRTTDLTVSEIAMRVGFENFSYFIRKFSSFYGLTPTAYRKTNKKD